MGLETWVHGASGLEVCGIPLGAMLVMIASVAWARSRGRHRLAA